MSITHPTLSLSGDGLINADEYQVGTNPRSEDMDGDFLKCTAHTHMSPCHILSRRTFFWGDDILRSISYAERCTSARNTKEY
jgi:hypothetical protein